MQAHVDSAFAIGDEWKRFNPFLWGHYLAGSVSLATFVVADAVIALYTVRRFKYS